MDNNLRNLAREIMMLNNKICKLTTAHCEKAFLSISFKEGNIVWNLE